MKDFTQLNVNDYDLGRVQDKIATTFDQLTRLQILDGVLLENINLVSGQDNLVAHKLDRAIRLWFVVKKNANANIWEQTTSVNNKFLNLHTTANCAVSLWVA